MVKTVAKQIVKRAHKAKEYISNAKKYSTSQRSHKPIDLHENEMQEKYGRSNYGKQNREEKKMGTLLLRQEMKKRAQK